MITNFSLSRLARLVRKQWVENSRMYIFASLALLALQALIFTFTVRANSPRFSEDIFYIIFLFGIFISGAIFASISFSILGDRTKGAYWLAFPASHLEKLLSMILYSTVFFTVIYVATFFLVKTVAVAYIQDMVEADPAKYTFNLLKNAKEFWTMFSSLMYTFFAVQAFYLLGSVYFPRYSFIITTIIGTAIIFLFFYFCTELSQTLLQPEYRWEGLSVRSFDEQPGSAFLIKQYSLSPFVSDLLMAMAKFIWAPIFWLVAWFRLKEKQV